MRGFVLSLGDWERDINAVGVPLVAPEKRRIRVQLRRAVISFHAREAGKRCGATYRQRGPRCEVALSGR